MRVRRPSSVSSLSAECPSGRRSQRIGTEVRGPAQRPPRRSPGRPRGAGAGRAAGGGIGGRGLANGTRMRSPWPAGTRAGRARFRVTHLLCFFFLSLSLPALRTHNLTVLPSHNSASVPANDSAYSNLSATVGEHVPVPHPPAARRGPRSRPRPVPSGSV